MPKFTPNQQRAVVESGHNILVSASAGSGKTTVLVARVIEKILSPTDPVSVDQLLIVTFTEAAAREMRDRIEVALKDAIQKPENAARLTYLQQQLILLPNANISTLHAFALRLIENYYHVIDLDPQFRLLADTAEVELMQQDVLEIVFNDLYETDDQFGDLVETLSTDRNDNGMQQAVLELYDFANARPDFDGWLDTLAQHYALADGHFVASDFYKSKLQPELKSTLARSVEQYNNAILELQVFDDDKNIAKRLAQFQEEATLLNAVTGQLLTGEWDEIRQTIANFAWPTIQGRAGKDMDPDAKDALTLSKNIRDNVKTEMTKLRDDFFLLDENSLLQVLAKTGDAVAELVKVVKAFTAAFNATKRKKQVLDFSDLEHFALEILSDNVTAQTLQARFREVMVDEYQDINPLQETVLSALSNGHNMFMVGDVKQSIYGFRLADPSLFTAKYEKFGESDNQDGQRIVLAENFRSQANVTNFTNLIFTQLMDKQLGDLSYDGPAKLVAGATDYPSELPQTATMMVYLEEAGDEVTDTAQVVPDKMTGQLLIVAQQIQQLITAGEVYDRKAQAMRPVQWSDIAILESTRKANLKLLDIFKQENIPVAINDADNYFQTTEINVMLSLLQVIDNPYQDIPLVATLRSPIVGLDENGLALIRAVKKSGNFYEALQLFLEKFADAGSEIEAMSGTFGRQVNEQLTKFMTQLATWREAAQQNKLVELIWRVYEDTGYLEYVGGMPAGLQRQANLHALYERAQSFEQSSYIGLFRFISYVEQLRKNDKDLAVASAEVTENAVQVMTIHGSKGLEFPIVFLLDATHKFNEMDLRQNLIIDADEGVAMTYMEPTTRLLMDTPQQALIRLKQKRRIWAEQMRVLYVALTRAEQQLYIVGAYDSAQQVKDRWLQGDLTPDLVLPEYVRLKANNFMDWLGMGIVRHPNFPTIFDEVTPNRKLVANPSEMQVEFFDGTKVQALHVAGGMNPLGAENSVEPEQHAAVSADFEQMRQILEYQYNHVAATQTTAYQSVSEVKRLFDDPDVLQAPQLVLDGAGQSEGNRLVADNDFAQPEFIAQGENRPSATAVGSATHLVLQQLDLTKPITRAVIEAEIDRLVQQQIITNDIGTLIRVDTLLTLFTSSFGKQLQANAATVKREQPFSLLMHARDIYQNYSGGDERILIHGIMDGYFTTPDQQVVLFDYKTDYIRPNNKVGGQAELLARYQGQLRLYAKALAAMQSLPVSHVVLYSLSLGEAIELKI
ncbi:helicase-exonuclease AddAB subunit AddA [Periweissella cryptocerci]|uniref:ATP-dependent helicase/nuclease subunit A n=1 Tax=Periweissella cryptocerci TaxID=2506420 RepID=A0A4P6YWP5_9LACO|nr:helicase-exonuclease AddAB subunit AddA [Periweissella cryptocerci]QBO37226.1 helicase-exonuclease AddAB subunit AddA [Periweissella cryptocerci]